MMSKKRLRDLDVETHLRDPEAKQTYVTTLFDLISGRYDRFTRLFSFGMDARWKRQLIEWVAPELGSGKTTLDLATGTGDLAALIAPFVQHGRVVGIDASREMCSLARRRPGKPSAGRTHFVVGDIMRLPVCDRFADAITIGYGLRNVPDFRVALLEIGRVLKPGGLLVTLDFYQPPSRAWRTSYVSYLRVAGAAVGWLWHREPAAYRYIANSIEHFVSAAQFTAVLEQQGFVVEMVSPKLWGGICLHKARKPLAGGEEGLPER